jgi:hypothetical protein
MAMFIAEAVGGVHELLVEIVEELLIGGGGGVAHEEMAIGLQGHWNDGTPRRPW